MLLPRDFDRESWEANERQFRKEPLIPTRLWLSLLVASLMLWYHA